MLIVTLPEATPVHEAASLQRDLMRAGITPFAWVINQSLAPLSLKDPMLKARRFHERPFIQEVSEEFAPRTALVPWQTDIARQAGNSPARTRVPRIRRSHWMKETTMKTIQVLGNRLLEVHEARGKRRAGGPGIGHRGPGGEGSGNRRDAGLRWSLRPPGVGRRRTGAILRSRAERPSDQGNPSVIASLRADNRLYRVYRRFTIREWGMIDGRPISFV